MKGIQRLAAIKSSTAPMARALPDLPMEQTVMVRLIRGVAAEMGQFFEPAFREIGLGENAFHVLCLLVAAEGGRLSPGDLSDLVGTSRANMTKIVETLSANGYVARCAVEHDGRRQLIEITEDGRAMTRMAVPTLAAPLRKAFSALTPEEFTKLNGLLQKTIVSFHNDALGLAVTSVFELKQRKTVMDKKASGS
jgi:MarR family transcriptional repressor of emrRAB